MMEPAEGKTYLVTGGSSGLGLAVTRALVERGATVAIAARGEDRMAAVADELGPRVIPVRMDVADKKSVEDGVGEVVARCGGLDGIVTCAGLTFAYRIEVLPEEKLREIVDISLIGTVLCCQAAHPVFAPTSGANRDDLVRECPAPRRVRAHGDLCRCQGCCREVHG